MNLPSITITGGALSDIFFNFDHENMKNLYAAAKGKGKGNGDEISAEDEMAALTADAKDFCQMIQEPELVEPLIADFMARR